MPVVPWVGVGKVLLLSTCFLREKEEARKEMERLTEDMIASQEVQGLMDIIGEVLPFSSKSRPAPGRKVSRYRWCLLWLLHRGSCHPQGVLCSVSWRMPFERNPRRDTQWLLTVGDS